MRNIDNYARLKDYGLQLGAESFRVSYVGYYEGHDKGREYRVFEISAAIDPEGRYCEKPVRYAVSVAHDEEHFDAVRATLAEDGAKVHSEKVENYYRPGSRLLYRDVKDLPVC